MGPLAMAHGLRDGQPMLPRAVLGQPPVGGAGPHFPAVLLGGVLQSPPADSATTLRELRASCKQVLGVAAGGDPPAKLPAPKVRTILNSGE